MSEQTSQFSLVLSLSQQTSDCFPLVSSMSQQTSHCFPLVSSMSQTIATVFLWFHQCLNKLATVFLWFRRCLNKTSQCFLLVSLMSRQTDQRREAKTTEVITMLLSNHACHPTTDKQFARMLITYAFCSFQFRSSVSRLV